jgi:hypothetical protein
LNKKCSGDSPSIDYSSHDEDNGECHNEDNIDDNNDNNEKINDKENDDGDDGNDDDYDKDGEDGKGDHNDDSNDGDDEGETKVEKMKDEEMTKVFEISKSGVCSLARNNRSSTMSLATLILCQIILKYMIEGLSAHFLL